MRESALNLHLKLKGKIEVKSKIENATMEDLSLLYSPGVAIPCLEIAEDESKSFDYTWRSNTIAVVSDGTAVLGLGDIGPTAAMPVMEGKAMLFKMLGDVNAVPLCIKSKSVEETIALISAMEPSFGGINLEDIKAPECIEIEQALKERLNIPVFHDDQHGTAIVVMAALMNASKLVQKPLETCRVVVSGTGAAGNAIIRMLHDYGVRDISAFNSQGHVTIESAKNAHHTLQSLAQLLNQDVRFDTLEHALDGADIFIGVSAANLLTADDINKMNENAIVLALANPDPEITYEEAKKGGARIVGTGRSDFPNQVNNILAFPGIFKGALDVGAKSISSNMKLAAAKAIAGLLTEGMLNEEHIIVSALDHRAVDAVAKAVKDEAIKEGLNTRKGDDCVQTE